MVPRLVLTLLLVLLASGAPVGASLADGGEFQQVYLTKDEALRHVFPDARRVVELKHLLADDETRAVEALLGRRLEEGGFYLYAAWDETPSGGAAGVAPPVAPSSYAAIVMEIGKVRPITHIVEVRPGVDGRTATAGRVAVMIYRETHGADVAGERFTAQYAGRTLDDPIRVDRDVINVAGSTLSAHAICRGVRKALAAVQVVLLGRDGATRDALLARATDVTPARPASHAPAARGREDADAPTSGAPDAGAASDDVLRERRVMGTLARVTLPVEGQALARGELERAAEAALDELQRWDGVLSDWRDDTPLSAFNRAAPDARVALDRDLAAFLRHADALVRATDGAFDPAVGALVDAWGLRTPTPARPDAATLAAARAASGWTSLALSPDGTSAARGQAGLRLDPGASGKGWALDRAADVLRARGVTRALLSFRSTLLAVGAPAGLPGFVVPVRHDGDGRDLVELVLADGALSVSGGLAAGFDDGDVQRGHVLDPRRGEPLPSARLAWVTSASAADADALSTALLVDGPRLPAFRDASGRLASGGFVAEAGTPPCAWPDAPAAASSPTAPGGAIARRAEAPARDDR